MLPGYYPQTPIKVKERRKEEEREGRKR